MKRQSFSSVINIFLLIFVSFFLFNCRSTGTPPEPETVYVPVVMEAPPRVQEPVVVQETRRSEDIWSLLRNGDSRAMGYFLGEIDVNAKDSQGRTPLHYAAENKDAQLASFLISLGADTNALDNSGQSPLGISIENGDPVITGLLVSAGADIHLPIKDSTTAAALALNADHSVFKAILTPLSIEAVDNEGKNILHLSCAAGNVRAVQDILSFSAISTAYINKLDNKNKTALDYAFERPDSIKHIETAEQLILSGGISDNEIFYYFAPAVRSANYDIRRHEGLAPIHFAVINNYSGLISFLLEKKIDPNIKSASGATALHEAARTGNVRVINQLIDYGADVNEIDAKGNTPLHLGIPADVHREVVTTLISRGANPNLKDEHGDTPLHIAIILNRPLAVVQSILNGSNSIHVRNIDGKTPLYIAVQERREELIPVLLSNGSEVFAADNSGITPFDLASRMGGNIFNLLVTLETVNQRDSAGNTMLHAAVRNWVNISQINRILNNRALVDARNMEGDTALHIAVRTNQRETGEFLISKGANIFSVNSAEESPLYYAFSSSSGIREWIINPTTIVARDGLGNNMLHYAAQWGFNSVLPVIIGKGISVDEPNATGETPLFMAIKNDNVSTIRTLLHNRANINARDTHGYSVLHAAVRWNAINSVPLLIASGIDVDVFTLDGNTPLHDAVSLGMAEIEIILIREGADLEVRNYEGNTPFMEAVRAGQLASMERLSGRGADISTRNTRGDTPLHIAIGMEQPELVNFLLRRGASIHARNTRNRTPFQISIGISPQMVSLLLTNDRVNITDDFGNSALHVALQERAGENIIRVILSRGVRINTVDSNGKTPLRLAVDTEQWASAKLLSDSGADPFLAAIDNKSPAEISFEKGEECLLALFSGRALNARDSSENTILHFAARLGNPQSINTLLNLGANKSARNISSEYPYETAIRWNKRENAELLRVSFGY